MADTKITALTAIGANPIIPSTFPIPMVDLTDTSMAASGTTKKVTVNQILGAGGTATLASATITGDLTVRTSKLAVTSAGVGFGTTSPNPNFQVTLNGLYGLRIQTADTNNSVANIGCDPASGYAFFDVTKTGTGSFLPLRFSTSDTERYRIAADGVATWSNVGGVAGTAMTLNSTGLGVGTTDTTNARFNVRAGTGATGNSAFFSNSDGTYNPYLQIQHSSSGVKLFVSSAYGTPSNNLIFGNGGVSETMRIDGSGNVGVGGNASATGIDTGVARLFVVAPNSNTGMAATFIADSVGRGLLVADQGKTNSFGVEIAAGLVKTGGFTSGTSVALYANAVERARVKSTGQVRFVPLAADPAGAETGDVYYNSVSNKLKCYDGTTWNDLF